MGVTEIARSADIEHDIVQQRGLEGGRPIIYHQTDALSPIVALYHSARAKTRAKRTNHNAGCLPENANARVVRSEKNEGGKAVQQT